MFGMSTRTGTRLLAPSLLALVTVGVTGCSLPVPGAALPVPLLPGPSVSVPALPAPSVPVFPAPAPAFSPSPLVAPGSTAGSGSIGSTTDSAGWERVTDPQTGDSTVLPGPATSRTHDDGHRVYSAVRPPAGLTTAMMEIAPVSGPVDLARFEAGTASSMGGRLVGSEQGQVQDRPALAARYELTVAGGRPAVAMIQYVQRPGYVLALAVVAPAGSGDAATRTIRTMAAGLQLGAGAGATAPAPVPVPVPVPGQGASSRVETYKEWFAAGWKYTPWTPANDPASRVSALLIGAEPEAAPAGAAPGVGYRSTGAPGGVVTHLRISSMTRELRVADLQYDAQRAADEKRGTLTSATPTTVGGHPALDARIDFTTAEGTPSVILLRAIATDRSVVTLHSFGPRSAERTGGQVQEISAGMLRVG